MIRLIMKLTREEKQLPIRLGMKITRKEEQLPVRLIVKLIQIIAAKSARRRALQLKLIPAHLKDCPVEKRRVLDIYKLSNLISKATGIEHHVDHMWPLSDGGPHWSGNMQIITARENLTKNASVDLEVKHNIQQALNETVADKFQVA
jgi:5-methylcytosine-specific restriction endonuclease McrA